MAVKRHILYDCWLTDPARLQTLAYWQPLLRAVAALSHSTILEERYHQFTPHGISAFLLLAESHISVHTWPEELLATLDIFSCGAMDPAAVVDFLRAQLTPRAEHVTVLTRGTVTTVPSA